MAEHVAAVDMAEIQSLRAERERYEESMKKAFMRGVCPQHVPHWKRDARSTTCTMPRPSSTILAQAHWPAASVRFSPLHFDPPVPSSQSDGDVRLSHTPVGSRAEVFPSTSYPQHPTTRGHCKLPDRSVHG